MSYNVMLEGLIKDIGGCGKFQWCLCAIMHLSKTIAAWTMLHMTFNGQEPTFFCRNNAYGVGYNQSENSCFTVNGTDCTSFRYDDEMHTAVSEVSRNDVFTY